MRTLIALVPVIVFAAASCGTAGSVSSPGEPGDTTDSNGLVATCRPTCTTAADCGTAGDPLYDPSHFACQSGLCQWLGCRAPSECSAEANGGTFLCQAPAAGAPPVCVPACQHPSDCVPPGTSGAGLQDASHYACTAGACVWRGCRSNAECVAATHTNKAACTRLPGAPAPTCVPTCTTSADCAMSGGGLLGDANHYACRAGICQWLGCKSTTECTTALSSNRYVCE